MEYYIDISDVERIVQRFEEPMLDKVLAEEHYLSPNLKLVSDDIGYGRVYFVDDDGCHEKISQSVFDILSQQSKLHIRKYKPCLNEHANFTLEIFDKPMQIARLCSSNPEHVLTWQRPPEPCLLSEYKYFKRKIGICGTASSGKSETAKRISNILNTKYKANSFHVVEYATTFIQKYGRPPEIMDQFFIWLGQKEREEKASKADIVISDCPTFLTYLYSVGMEKSGLSLEKIALFMSKLYKRVLFDLSGYSDIVFLQLKEYHPNNIRYQNYEQAMKIQESITRFLSEHNIIHIPATYDDFEKIFDALFYINKLKNESQS